MKIRDRIKSLKRIKASDLRPNPAQRTERPGELSTPPAALNMTRLKRNRIMSEEKSTHQGVGRQARPGTRGPVPAGIENRLWSRVAIMSPGECWLWTGYRNASGYGRIRIGTAADGSRKMEGTHRVAYEMGKGPIPAGHGVLHHCDTPACCNPSHLFTGTNTDNNRDRDTKGRGTTPPTHRGEANPRAKLQATDIAVIKQLSAEGETQTAIGERFGVCHSTIGRILRGEAWMNAGGAAE